MKVCRHYTILFSSSDWEGPQMESAVTAPVSGHIKRVVVHEGAWVAPIWISSQLWLPGDSINQGDLTVEIVH